MKKKLFNGGKGRFLRRLFSAMLVVALLSTGTYTDVSAGDRSLYSDSVHEDTGTSSGSGVRRLAAEANGTDIFDNTTITLYKFTLKASYQDDQGRTQIVDLAQNGKYELPYNAGINMRLDFQLGRPSAIESGRPYTYKLPEGIRVDVNAHHDLADNEGKSIGTVDISRDGTLTFIFDELEDNTLNRNIPFYVQFEGGLSEESQEGGKHVDIKFPTVSGSFDFSVDTTGKTGVEEKPQTGPVTMEKTGHVINVNGQNYIEWKVSLGANGRDYITGTIHDDLPTGLKYAEVQGYPKVEGLSYDQNKGKFNGDVKTNAKDGATSIDINVVECKPYYRADVIFLTHYDETIFGGGVITANTGKEIKNSATFRPEDNSEWSEDEGQVYIRPDMLSKSGSKVDANGNITWTVVINKEGLNINGLTYDDTFGAGQKLEGDISGVEPGLVSKKVDGSGFVIHFPNEDNRKTYTLIYTTHVTDIAQPSKNTGVLKDNDGSRYNVTQEATVPGVTLIQKNCRDDYNSVTNRFTWDIVVNPDNVKMDNVVVTDKFDPTMMKFVSATEPVTGDTSNGEIVFNLDTLDKRKVITVVTEIVDPGRDWEYDWTGFKNHSEITSSLNSNPVSADAEKYVQVKKPNLIQKYNNKKDNGTVEWTITVLEPKLKVEGLTVTDIIPDGMEYIPGTFRIQNMYYDEHPVYKEPSIGTSEGKQTISYTLSKTPAESRFYTQGFQIIYSTKVPDLDKANESGKYTNHAEISVTYEGNVTVTDDVESTVEGTIGGVVNKTYDYKWGTRDVEWTVTINETRNDMTGIRNPKIYDDLADYFDYAGGKLYKLDAKGNRKEVPESQYVVTVVNGKIIVQLPDIGKDCYQFVFTTRFNCLAGELEGKKITNTVVFEGDGKSYEKESASVDNVNFSSSSAGSLTRREIRVKKVDSATKAPLPGARFELLLNGEVIGEATSGEDGYAVFECYNTLLGYKLQLSEIQAPDGYTGLAEPLPITDYDQDHLVPGEGGVQYYEIVVPNANKDRVNTAEIHIKKVNEYGGILSGAKIGLYKDVACTDVPDTRITNSSGLADFSGLTEGTYYLKEMTPPPGYKLPSPNNAVAVVIAKDPTDNDKMTVTYDGIAKDLYTMENTHAVGELRIKKVAKGSTTGISGASFSIYDKTGERVVSGTTDGNGLVTLSGLTLGETYYYKETAAPNRYVLDTGYPKNPGYGYPIVVGKGTETEDQTKEITVENELATGNIVITKTDNGTPAKRLSGVEFTLYAEDGKTVLSEKPAKTDSNGVAVFTNIPFGNYVIKETTGKTGYATAADKNITVKQLGDTEVTMVNKVIKCDIRIIKADKDNPEIKLSGAKFGLYQGERLMASGITNTDGVVVFHDIPYGEGKDYVLRELESPEGYKAATETWTITGANIEAGFANPDGVYQCDVITNEKEKGSIKLLKLGEQVGPDNRGNGDFAPLAGAKFTLFDENMLTVDKEESDENGHVNFPELRYGTYYIQETMAPDGFVRDMAIYKVVVTSDLPEENVVTYKKDEADEVVPVVGGSFEVENYKSNAPYVSLKLKKVDSENEEKPVPNATFVMYKIFEGETVELGSAVTGEDGIAYFKRIHIETDNTNTEYFIKEISSPAGYYDPASDKKIPLGNRDNMNTYGDPRREEESLLENNDILWVGGSADIKEVADKAIVENDPIKGKIVITKTAIAEGNPPLKGVTYTLLDEKKDEVATATTDSSGLAAFLDLPCGIYYVKETGVPAGYTLSAEETRVVIVDDKQKDLTYKDAPIAVWVSKQAVDGSADIQGAAFEVIDEETGKTVDSWTSNDQKPHYVAPPKDNAQPLQINKTYILSEIVAPKGYGYMEDAEFTVNSDGSITVTGKDVEKSGQTIIVRDRPVNLTISKQDEKNPGSELANATLAIFDANNERIHSFTTNGIAPYEVPVGILTVPKTGYNVYTLREISAPDGYAFAQDIIFHVSEDGSVYQCDEYGKNPTLTNNGTITMLDKKKEPFYLRKLDANTRLDVSGAVFEIWACNEDTLEEQGSPTFNDYVSDSRPIKVDLLSPGVYKLKEVGQPEGYLSANDIVFRLTFDGSTPNIEILEGNRAINLNPDGDTFMIYDAPIELKIRKQDSFGMILKGAKLQLTKYDIKTGSKVGKPIAEFTSDGQKSYTVRSTDLALGAYYILEELYAPDGYKRAANIIIHIDKDGVVTREDNVKVVNNTIVMEDEEAGLGIGKFDLDNVDDCLSGCKLKLETVDDPWWKTQTWTSDGTVKTWDMLELTPGCTYILTEMEAPTGYAYTDPITFTIDKDDHQVYQIIDGERADDPEDNRTVKIKDGKIKLTVSKQNIYSKMEVPGAEFSILDKEGDVLASWTSGSEPCEVDTSKLIAGNGTNAEYILREVTAPNGYRKAADIPFAIDRDGNIYQLVDGDYKLKDDNMLTMYDEPMFTIEKMDTSGNPIAGAELTITAKDDMNFEPISWETTKEGHSFEEGTFTPGVTYILTETKAPDGYGYAQSVEFMVTADNEILVNGVPVENKRIVMLDYPIKVLVSKQDGGNKQSLAGAILVIKDETGKELYTFTSAGEPVLLPNGIFKAVQGGLTYYTLSETKAPDGYQIAKDIEFAIDSSGNLLQKDEKGSYVRREDNTLVMLDYVKNSEDSNNSSTPSTGTNTNTNTSTNTNKDKNSVSSNTTKAPKTGDSTPLGTLIALCAAGFLGAGVIFGLYFRRRRRRS